MKQVFLIIFLLTFSIGPLKSNNIEKLSKKNALYLLEKESFNLDYRAYFYSNDSILSIIENSINIDSLSNTNSINLFNYYSIKYANIYNTNLDSLQYFYLKKMKLIADKNNSAYLLSKYYFYLAQFYQSKTQIPNALNYYNEAINISKNESSDSLFLFNLYLKLSAYYLYVLEEFDKSKYYIDLALKQLNNIQNNCNCFRMQSFGLLSMVNIKSENFKEAEKSLNQAYSYITDNTIKICPQIAYKYYEFMSRYYTDLKYYGLAENYVDSAILLLKKDYSNSLYMSNLYILKGHIFFKQKDFPKSLIYNEMAKNYRIENNMNDNAIKSSYINLAIDYFYLKNYNKSLKYLDTALLHYTSINYNNRIYHYISMNYEKLGDYKNAFYFFKKYKNIDDSLSNLKNLSKIEFLNYNKELLEKENQISTLKIERQQSKNLIFILILTILFIALGFFGYLYLLKRQQNKKLVFKNKLIEKSKISLKKAKILAEKSDKLKSEFLANMSHDIRTPLNAIVGFSSIMFDKDIEEKKRKEFADIVIQNSKILLRLIDDILEFSRIESDDLKFSFKKFSVQKSIQNSIENNIKAADKKGLIIEFIDSCKYEVFNDEIRFQQVMNNLISNAIKYSKQGIIKISCKSPYSDLIQINVEDEGIGIDKEESAYIFDKFRRGKHYEKTGKSISGTGLGLAISKRLIKGMGGKIWLESKEDKGSVFSFTIKTKMQ